MPFDLWWSLTKVMQVTAIAIMHGEKPNTKVFTTIHVQTSETEMPDNKIQITEERKLHVALINTHIFVLGPALINTHTALLPQPIISNQLQLIFDT